MKAMTATVNKPKYFRAGTAHGIERVDREGGAFGHGVIYGAAVITRGEALGHELWVDADFLTDVTAAINASETGIKGRFTHPGLSSDGVGSKLGRFENARTVGDRVIADLHFQEAATKTPDGDLADYVMTLAEETPEDFGLSIVFEHDMEAEDAHVAEHSVQQGQRAIFVSPDEDNKENYRHARLQRLRAADVVDSPAANPDGLFKRGQEAATEADSILSYALRLSDAKPDTSCLNIDGDRAQQFVARFLERHNLSLQKGGDSVSDDKPAVEEPLSREDVAKEFRDGLNRYVEAFGSENGAKWYSEGVSFEDAQTKHIDHLQKQLSVKDARIEELQETLNSIDRGEDQGGEFNTDEQQGPKTFASKIRISGKSYEQN